MYIRVGGRASRLAPSWVLLTVLGMAAPGWAQAPVSDAAGSRDVAAHTSSSRTAADRQRVTAALNHQPIRFEPLSQKGMFLARGIGPALRLSGTSIDFPIDTGSPSARSIRVQFVGAKRSSRVTGLARLPGHVNYLLGDDPSRWRSNVPTYARARTVSLYRGVDVEYYGAEDRLEYDLIVRPRARPDVIRLAVSGASSVSISEDGDLVYGEDQRVLLRRPVAYQTFGGVRRVVAVVYHRFEDGTVGFAVGAYDRSQILVIDPVVAYSFSFGGSGEEYVYDIAVDETGAVYVGGETYSVDFPTVKPAQGRQDAGTTCNFYGIGNSICRDAFLAKLAPDGKSLEYATYFGSADFDQVNHIAVDSSHALYFAGWTTTQTTSPQPDVRNSFIGKLAPDGSHFVYTYYSPRCCLSGPQLTINDLAIGPDGSAYVATSTPTASEVAVLSPAGTNYHSIFTLTDPSGVRRTTFTSIVVRGNSMFVGGDTTWSAFPTTLGGWQRAFSGIRDGVLMRVALDGTLAYSTFVGFSNGSVTVADVAVDQDGSVYAVSDWSEADPTCSPTSTSAHHSVVLTTLSADGASLASLGFPYPFDACLLPPVRIALDDRSNAHFAACGYGTDLGRTVSRMSCTLWKIRPTGFIQDFWHIRTFSDVPSHRFAIDSGGANRWFAPVTGQVSFVKLVSQFTLRSLISSTSSPMHFGSPIVLHPDLSTEDDIEVSYRRYSPGLGWAVLQEFAPYAEFAGYSQYFTWTSAWWDVGDQIVCVDVRLAGSTDTPQSKCLNFTITGLAPGEPPVAAPTADFNRDQRPDLIWSNSATGELAVWSLGGGGRGERVLSGAYLNSSALPPDWRVAGSADIDGDGQTDLFLQSATGLLGAWFFDGVTLRNGITLTPGQVGDPNWQIRAVGDLNHDGHPDLIWQYAPTGQSAFWLMDGTSAIGYVIPDVMAPGGDWEIVGTGDSNRDGERDIFWQQRSTGTLAVWWMSGTKIQGASLLSASPGDPKWRAVAVADLDGDAYSDLIFQHTDTRIAAAWYLRDATVRFGATLMPSTVGDPAWKIVGPR
jgi:hypothetical protein